MNISRRTFSNVMHNNLAVCKKCIYYVPPSFPNSSGQCQFETTLNNELVTGEKSYIDAVTCRLDETKCGVRGKFYKRSLPKTSSIGVFLYTFFLFMSFFAFKNRRQHPRIRNPLYECP